MSSKPIKRVSALASNYTPGRVDVDGKIGVLFQEVPDLKLWQLATWHDKLANFVVSLSEATGIEETPGPARVVTNDHLALLRVEPLKFWIKGMSVTEVPETECVTLDLSHSRTHLRLTGPQAKTVLNRYLSLDLRDQSFAPGSVASTAFHHVGVTLWRSDDSFELFLPRGFALSLWELLLQSAAQFGYEVS